MSLKRRLDRLEASMHSGRNLWLFVRCLDALEGTTPAEVAALRAELAATPNDAPVLAFCRALLEPEIIAPYLRDEHGPT